MMKALNTMKVSFPSRSANEEETYLSLVFCAVLDAWRKKNKAAED